MRVVAALLLAAFCLVAPPAFAQEFSDADRAQVEQRIAELMAVIESGDPAGAIDVVPPRLYRYIGERIGVSESEIRDHLRGVAAQAMTGVEVLEYTVTLDGAEPRLTPDGSRTYLLLPTVMRMRSGADVVRSESSTLAFEDEGRWGLVRIGDQPQVDLLVEVWPGFTGVNFPLETMVIE